MKRFKVSRDPRFVEKLEDVVGLYLSPAEHALVFCCDEKSQVQALDRTQPGLPMKKAFIWTAKAKDILEKVIRANSRLSSKQNATLH